MTDSPKITAPNRESDASVTLSRKELEALLEAAAERGAERGARKALRAVHTAEPSVSSVLSAPQIASEGAGGWKFDRIDLKTAARLLGRTRNKAVAIIHRHGLGSLRDGRWNVCRRRLEAFLEGRPYPRLDPTSQA